MNHRISNVKLGRNRAHRRSLLSNMASSLIMFENIVTSISKAKALSRFVDRLVTCSKKSIDSDNIIRLNCIRELLSQLSNKNSVKKLVDELSVRYKKRSGGYTSIVKLGNRKGDSSQIVSVRFV